MAFQRRVEQWSELRVNGPSHGVDFEPEELSRRLRITPARTARRGDRLRSGRVRPYTFWQWRTDERIETDCEVLVCEVLDVFEPVSTELARARTEWNLELVVGLVVSMHGAMETEDDGSLYADAPTPASALSAETIKRLARMGCHLDIDQYVIVPGGA